MMDPSVGWDQSEHNGPGARQWRRIWRDYCASKDITASTSETATTPTTTTTTTAAVAVVDTDRTQVTAPALPSTPTASSSSSSQPPERVNYGHQHLYRNNNHISHHSSQYRSSPAQQHWCPSPASAAVNDLFSKKRSQEATAALMAATLAKEADNPALITDLSAQRHLIERHNGTPWYGPDHPRHPYHSHHQQQRQQKRSGVDSGVAANSQWSAATGSQRPTAACDWTAEEAMDHLHREIEMFYDYMSPTEHEKRVRREVLQRITKAIETLWRDVVVQCFGSYSTDTYLPTSDIDLVVIGRWTYLPLVDLEQYFLMQRFCHPHQILVLDRATVPIIKMTDNWSGIRINISFNLKQVFKSVDLVVNYIKEMPNVKKVLLIIKQFLLQRDLNEVFKGGLSSYSLVLMVVHFFQTNERARKEANLGRLLLQFLELYGLILNYQEVGLRLAGAGGCRYVSKRELLATTVQHPQPQTVVVANGGHQPYHQHSYHRPSLLIIEDPLDATNNVSRNSYAMDKCRDAFAYAFRTLYMAVGPNRAVIGDRNESILGRVVRVTDQVVDRRLYSVPHQRQYCHYPYGQQSCARCSPKPRGGYNSRRPYNNRRYNNNRNYGYGTHHELNDSANHNEQQPQQQQHRGYNNYNKPNNDYPDHKSSNNWISSNNNKVDGDGGASVVSAGSGGGTGRTGTGTGHRQYSNQNNYGNNKWVSQHQYRSNSYYRNNNFNTNNVDKYHNNHGYSYSGHNNHSHSRDRHHSGNDSNASNAGTGAHEDSDGCGGTNGVRNGGTDHRRDKSTGGVGTGRVGSYRNAVQPPSNYRHYRDNSGHN